MDLSELTRLIRKRWLAIVLLTLAGTLAAGAVTYTMTPMYTAATRVHFAVGGGESVSDLAQGSTFTEKQMGSYVEAARSALVLDPVIDELALDTDSRSLARTIDVTVPEGTMVLEIAATHADAETAAGIANETATQLSDATVVLSPARADGTDSVVATVLTPAYVPDEASFPKVAANLALGVALGLLLGLGFAAVRHVLDTKVRDSADVAVLTELPVIGTVPFEHDGVRCPIFMHDDPTGPRSEALRRLRTNLKFVNRSGGARTLLVTSSISSEGKTTTAINLALTLADAGSRVLLVDADLRRPAVSEYLGLEGRAGLTSVLIGSAELSEVTQPWRSTGMDVLTAGEVPPNPTDLLGSTEMAAVMAEATASYDVVVIDSPPVLPVTDAAVLSALTAGTLLVCGSDRVTKPQLRQGLDALALVDAHVLGVVVNKMAVPQTGGYYGYRSTGSRTGASANRRGRRTVMGESGRPQARAARSAVSSRSL